MENITLMTVSPLNLAPIIYGFVAVLALFGALAGLWRGFLRQTVRTTTIVISLVASYALLSIGYGYFDRFLDGKTMADVEGWLRSSRIITPDVDLSWIYNFDVHTAELILKLPLSLVLMPIIFVACFVVISFVMVIAHKIVCAVCGFGVKNVYLTEYVVDELLFEFAVTTLVCATFDSLHCLGTNGTACCKPYVF